MLKKETPVIKDEMCPVCQNREGDCVCCPECGHLCVLNGGELYCPTCGPKKSKP